MTKLGNVNFFTVSEVSQLFGRSEEYVRKSIRTGLLPATKIGKSYLIEEDVVRDEMAIMREEKIRKLQKLQSGNDRRRRQS